MHGEFRPPGGKLVTADVEAAGGELARVQVSGDFFPGPNGDRGRLNAALAGIPAVQDVPAMTARITAGARPAVARFCARDPFCCKESARSRCNPGAEEGVRR